MLIRYTPAMSTYVCHVCRGRDECTCDGARIAEERDEARERAEALAATALEYDEAAALLKVLEKVDFTGGREYVRLDDAETAAVESAREKLRAMVDGD